MIRKYNCCFVREILSEGGQLIDVRSAVEFNMGALNGAVNMPVDSFETLKNYIDTARPVLLYCRNGARSEMIKNYLQSLGYESVHNIGGYRKFIDC